jgi:hypothetical protein
LEWVLKRLGLKRSLYFRWQHRRTLGQLEDQDTTPVDLHRVLPEEENAVIDFALAHPRDGYRRLTFSRNETFCC